jgi:hypothetical protein
MKIGSRDSMGRLWTQKRQDSIERAWKARHGSRKRDPREPQTFQVVRSNSINAAVTEYMRSVRRLKRAKSRLHDVLKYIENHS